MIGISMYRLLLRLYPAPHRRQFGEEMITVFGEIRTDAASRGVVARIVFYIRESAGLIASAVQEHWRRLGGDPDVLWFSPRRTTMHTEFRFPKTTAVLMTIILAGVVLAIKKGEAISTSLRGAASPPIGPIHPVHSVLLGGILMWFVFFYAAAMIGWAILFAVRRSGYIGWLGPTPSRNSG